jgi:hypothetical protein
MRCDAMRQVIVGEMEWDNCSAWTWKVLRAAQRFSIFSAILSDGRLAMEIMRGHRLVVVVAVAMVVAI